MRANKLMGRLFGGKKKETRTQVKKSLCCCMRETRVSATYYRQHKRQRQITKERMKHKKWEWKNHDESVKSALWVQLVKRRGVKGRKEREKTVSERGEGGGESDGWVGRATGGRYRERQEAGQRDRPIKKEAQQREERGRQSGSVSISLAPSRLCGCMLSTSQIAILKELNSVA